jgi:hypothetical protein
LWGGWAGGQQRNQHKQQQRKLFHGVSFFVSL